jgi:hypothetical protein
MELSAQPKGGETGQKSTDPKGKGMTLGETKGQPGKSTTQSEPKSKGTAEFQPKEPGTKGSAQTQPKEPSGKGKAHTQQQPKEPAGKGTTAKGPSRGDRVQLSEQQRTNVHSTILKESNVNRATNVNFSVNVGTRVPRSVRLMALPAAVLSIVPQYPSYRYFVANDQVCIVDPGSYEIVEVISGPGRTAGVDNRDATARPVLTEEEKAIILREVGMDGGSTMGLGALREGARVPHSVQVRDFPDKCSAAGAEGARLQIRRC